MRVSKYLSARGAWICGLLLIALCASACQLASPEPSTPRQAVAVGYLVLAELGDARLTAISDGLISPAEGDKTLAAMTDAYTALTAARAAIKVGDAVNARRYIDASDAALDIVRSVLVARGVPLPKEPRP